MKKTNNLTEQQNLIAEVILSFYEPGTIADHNSVIEIDDFIDLWSTSNRPRLSEIEKVMELIGFKEDSCRKDFSFYVKTNISNSN